MEFFGHQITFAPLYTAPSSPPKIKKKTAPKKIEDYSDTQLKKEMKKTKITAAPFFKLPAFKRDRDILNQYLTGWLSPASTKKIAPIEHLITKSKKPYVSINIEDRFNKKEEKGRKERWDFIWRNLPLKYKKIIQLRIHRILNGTAQQQLKYGRKDEIKFNKSTKLWELTN